MSDRHRRQRSTLPGSSTRRARNDGREHSPYVVEPRWGRGTHRERSSGGRHHQHRDFPCSSDIGPSTSTTPYESRSSASARNCNRPSGAQTNETGGTNTPLYSLAAQFDKLKESISNLTAEAKRAKVSTRKSTLCPQYASVNETRAAQSSLSHRGSRQNSRQEVLTVDEEISFNLKPRESLKVRKIRPTTLPEQETSTSSQKQYGRTGPPDVSVCGSTQQRASSPHERTGGTRSSSLTEWPRRHSTGERIIGEDNSRERQSTHRIRNSEKHHASSSQSIEKTITGSLESPSESKLPNNSERTLSSEDSRQNRSRSPRGPDDCSRPTSRASQYSKDEPARNTPEENPPKFQFVSIDSGSVGTSVKTSHMKYPRGKYARLAFEERIGRRSHYLQDPPSHQIQSRTVTKQGADHKSVATTSWKTNIKEGWKVVSLDEERKERAASKTKRIQARQRPTSRTKEDHERGSKSRNHREKKSTTEEKNLFDMFEMSPNNSQSSQGLSSEASTETLGDKPANRTVRPDEGSLPSEAHRPGKIRNEELRQEPALADTRLEDPAVDASDGENIFEQIAAEVQKATAGEVNSGRTRKSSCKKQGSTKEDKMTDCVVNLGIPKGRNKIGIGNITSETLLKIGGSDVTSRDSSDGENIFDTMAKLSMNPNQEASPGSCEQSHAGDSGSSLKLPAPGKGHNRDEGLKEDTEQPSQLKEDTEEPSQADIQSKDETAQGVSSVNSQQSIEQTSEKSSVHSLDIVQDLSSTDSDGENIFDKMANIHLEKSKDVPMAVETTKASSLKASVPVEESAEVSTKGRPFSNQCNNMDKLPLVEDAETAGYSKEEAGVIERSSKKLKDDGNKEITAGMEPGAEFNVFTSLRRVTRSEKQQISIDDKGMSSSTNNRDKRDRGGSNGSSQMRMNARNASGSSAMERKETESSARNVKPGSRHTRRLSITPKEVEDTEERKQNHRSTETIKAPKGDSSGQDVKTADISAMTAKAPPAEGGRKTRNSCGASLFFMFAREEEKGGEHKKQEDRSTEAVEAPEGESGGSGGMAADTPAIAPTAGGGRKVRKGRTTPKGDGKSSEHEKQAGSTEFVVVSGSDSSSTKGKAADTPALHAKVSTSGRKTRKHTTPPKKKITRRSGQDDVVTEVVEVAEGGSEREAVNTSTPPKTKMIGEEEQGGIVTDDVETVRALSDCAATEHTRVIINGEKTSEQIKQDVSVRSVDEVLDGGIYGSEGEATDSTTRDANRSRTETHNMIPEEENRRQQKPGAGVSGAVEVPDSASGGKTTDTTKKDAKDSRDGSGHGAGKHPAMTMEKGTVQPDEPDDGVTEDVEKHGGDSSGFESDIVGEAIAEFFENTASDMSLAVSTSLNDDQDKLISDVINDLLHSDPGEDEEIPCGSADRDQESQEKSDRDSVIHLSQERAKEVRSDISKEHVDIADVMEEPPTTKDTSLDESSSSGTEQHDTSPTSNVDANNSRKSIQNDATSACDPGYTVLNKKEKSESAGAPSGEDKENIILTGEGEEPKIPTPEKRSKKNALTATNDELDSDVVKEREAPMVDSDERSIKTDAVEHPDSSTAPLSTQEKLTDESRNIFSILEEKNKEDILMLSKEEKGAVREQAAATGVEIVPNDSGIDKVSEAVSSPERADEFQTCQEELTGQTASDVTKKGDHLAVNNNTCVTDHQDQGNPATIEKHCALDEVSNIFAISNDDKQKGAEPGSPRGSHQGNERTRSGKSNSSPPIKNLDAVPDGGDACSKQIPQDVTVVMDGSTPSGPGPEKPTEQAVGAVTEKENLAANNNKCVGDHQETGNTVTIEEESSSCLLNAIFSDDKQKKAEPKLPSGSHLENKGTVNEQEETEPGSPAGSHRDKERSRTGMSNFVSDKENASSEGTCQDVTAEKDSSAPSNIPISKGSRSHKLRKVAEDNPSETAIETITEDEGKNIFAIFDPVNQEGNYGSASNPNQETAMDKGHSSPPVGNVDITSSQGDVSAEMCSGDLPEAGSKTSVTFDNDELDCEPDGGRRQDSQKGNGYLSVHIKKLGVTASGRIPVNIDDTPAMTDALSSPHADAHPEQPTKELHPTTNSVEFPGRPELAESDEGDLKESVVEKQSADATASGGVSEPIRVESNHSRMVDADNSKSELFKLPLDTCHGGSQSEDEPPPLLDRFDESNHRRDYNSSSGDECSMPVIVCVESVSSKDGKGGTTEMDHKLPETEDGTQNTKRVLPQVGEESSTASSLRQSRSINEKGQTPDVSTAPKSDPRDGDSTDPCSSETGRNSDARGISVGPSTSSECLPEQRATATESLATPHDTAKNAPSMEVDCGVDKDVDTIEGFTFVSFGSKEDLFTYASANKKNKNKKKSSSVIGISWSTSRKKKPVKKSPPKPQKSIFPGAFKEQSQRLIDKYEEHFRTDLSKQKRREILHPALLRRGVSIKRSLDFGIPLLIDLELLDIDLDRREKHSKKKKKSKKSKKTKSARSTPSPVDMLTDSPSVAVEGASHGESALSADAAPGQDRTRQEESDQSQQARSSDVTKAVPNARMEGSSANLQGEPLVVHSRESEKNTRQKAPEADGASSEEMKTKGKRDDNLQEILAGEHAIFKPFEKPVLNQTLAFFSSELDTYLHKEGSRKMAAPTVSSKKPEKKSAPSRHRDRLNSAIQGISFSSLFKAKPKAPAQSVSGDGKSTSADSHSQKDVPSSSGTPWRTSYSATRIGPTILRKSTAGAARFKHGKYTQVSTSNTKTTTPTKHKGSQYLDKIVANVVRKVSDSQPNLGSGVANIGSSGKESSGGSKSTTSQNEYTSIKIVENKIVHFGEKTKTRVSSTGFLPVRDPTSPSFKPHMTKKPPESMNTRKMTRKKRKQLMAVALGPPEYPMPRDYEDKPGSQAPCGNDFCRLGCVCESLGRVVDETDLQHCRKVECMFECSCERFPSLRIIRSRKRPAIFSEAGMVFYDGAGLLSDRIDGKKRKFYPNKEEEAPKPKNKAPEKVPSKPLATAVTQKMISNTVASTSKEATKSVPRPVRKDNGFARGRIYIAKHVRYANKMEELRKSGTKREADVMDSAEANEGIPPLKVVRTSEGYALHPPTKPGDDDGEENEKDNGFKLLKKVDKMLVQSHQYRLKKTKEAVESRLLAFERDNRKPEKNTAAVSTASSEPNTSTRDSPPADTGMPKQGTAGGVVVQEEATTAAGGREGVLDQNTLRPGEPLSFVSSSSTPRVLGSQANQLLQAHFANSAPGNASPTQVDASTSHEVSYQPGEGLASKLTEQVVSTPGHQLLASLQRETEQTGPSTSKSINTVIVVSSSSTSMPVTTPVTASQSQPNQSLPSLPNLRGSGKTFFIVKNQVPVGTKPGNLPVTSTGMKQLGSAKPSQVPVLFLTESQQKLLLGRTLPQAAVASPQNKLVTKSPSAAVTGGKVIVPLTRGNPVPRSGPLILPSRGAKATFLQSSHASGVGQKAQQKSVAGVTSLPAASPSLLSSQSVSSPTAPNPPSSAADPPKNVQAYWFKDRNGKPMLLVPISNVKKNTDSGSQQVPGDISGNPSTMTVAQQIELRRKKAAAGIGVATPKNLSMESLNEMRKGAGTLREDTTAAVAYRTMVDGVQNQVFLPSGQLAGNAVAVAPGKSDPSTVAQQLRQSSANDAILSRPQLPTWYSPKPKSIPPLCQLAGMAVARQRQSVQPETKHKKESLFVPNFHPLNPNKSFHLLVDILSIIPWNENRKQLIQVVYNMAATMKPQGSVNVFGYVIRRLRFKKHVQVAKCINVSSSVAKNCTRKLRIIGLFESTFLIVLGASMRSPVPDSQVARDVQRGPSQQSNRESGKRDLERVSNNQKGASPRKQIPAFIDLTDEGETAPVIDLTEESMVEREVTRKVTEETHFSGDEKQITQAMSASTGGVPQVAHYSSTPVRDTFDAFKVPETTSVPKARSKESNKSQAKSTVNNDGCGVNSEVATSRQGGISSQLQLPENYPRGSEKLNNDEDSSEVSESNPNRNGCEEVALEQAGRSSQASQSETGTESSKVAQGISGDSEAMDRDSSSSIMESGADKNGCETSSEETTSKQIAGTSQGSLLEDYTENEKITENIAEAAEMFDTDDDSPTIIEPDAYNNEHGTTEDELAKKQTQETTLESLWEHSTGSPEVRKVPDTESDPLTIMEFTESGNGCSEQESNSEEHESAPHLESPKSVFPHLPLARDQESEALKNSSETTAKEEFITSLGSNLSTIDPEPDIESAEECDGAKDVPATPVQFLEKSTDAGMTNMEEQPGMVTDDERSSKQETEGERSVGEVLDGCEMVYDTGSNSSSRAGSDAVALQKICADVITSMVKKIVGSREESPHSNEQKMAMGEDNSGRANLSHMEHLTTESGSAKSDERHRECAPMVDSGDSEKRGLTPEAEHSDILDAEGIDGGEIREHKTQDGETTPREDPTSSETPDSSRQIVKETEEDGEHRGPETTILDAAEGKESTAGSPLGGIDDGQTIEENDGPEMLQTTVCETEDRQSIEEKEDEASEKEKTTVCDIMGEKAETGDGLTPSVSKPRLEEQTGGTPDSAVGEAQNDEENVSSGMEGNAAPCSQSGVEDSEEGDGKQAPVGIEPKDVEAKSANEAEKSSEGKSELEKDTGMEAIIQKKTDGDEGDTSRNLHKLVNSLSNRVSDVGEVEEVKTKDVSIGNDEINDEEDEDVSSTASSTEDSSDIDSDLEEEPEVVPERKPWFEGATSCSIRPGSLIETVFDGNNLFKASWPAGYVGTTGSAEGTTIRRLFQSSFLSGSLSGSGMSWPLKAKKKDIKFMSPTSLSSLLEKGEQQWQEEKLKAKKLAAAAKPALRDLPPSQRLPKRDKVRSLEYCVVNKSPEEERVSGDDIDILGYEEEEDDYCSSDGESIYTTSSFEDEQRTKIESLFKLAEMPTCGPTSSKDQEDKDREGEGRDEKRRRRGLSQEETEVKCLEYVSSVRNQLYLRDNDFRNSDSDSELEIDIEKMGDSSASASNSPLLTPKDVFTAMHRDSYRVSSGTISGTSSLSSSPTAGSRKRKADVLTPRKAAAGEEEQYVSLFVKHPSDDEGGTDDRSPARRMNIHILKERERRANQRKHFFRLAKAVFYIQPEEKPKVAILHEGIQTITKLRAESKKLKEELAGEKYLNYTRRRRIKEILSEHPHLGSLLLKPTSSSSKPAATGASSGGMVFKMAPRPVERQAGVRNLIPEASHPPLEDVTQAAQKLISAMKVVMSRRGSDGDHICNWTIESLLDSGGDKLPSYLRNKECLNRPPFQLKNDPLTPYQRMQLEKAERWRRKKHAIMASMPPLEDGEADDSQRNSEDENESADSDEDIQEEGEQPTTTKPASSPVDEASKDRAAASPASPMQEEEEVGDPSADSSDDSLFFIEHPGGKLEVLYPENIKKKKKKKKKKKTSKKRKREDLLESKQVSGEDDDSDQSLAELSKFLLEVDSGDESEMFKKKKKKKKSSYEVDFEESPWLLPLENDTEQSSKGPTKTSSEREARRFRKKKKKKGKRRRVSDGLQGLLPSIEGDESNQSPARQPLQDTALLDAEEESNESKENTEKPVPRERGMEPMLKPSVEEDASEQPLTERPFEDLTAVDSGVEGDGWIDDEAQADDGWEQEEAEGEDLGTIVLGADGEEITESVEAAGVEERKREEGDHHDDIVRQKTDKEADPNYIATGNPDIGNQEENGDASGIDPDMRGEETMGEQEGPTIVAQNRECSEENDEKAEGSEAEEAEGLKEKAEDSEEKAECSKEKVEGIEDINVDIKKIIPCIQVEEKADGTLDVVLQGEYSDEKLDELFALPGVMEYLKKAAASKKGAKAQPPGAPR